MIEINLLPEELKVKTRGKLTGIGIGIKHFLYLIPFVLGVLICAHVYLAVLNITRNNQLRILNNRWLSYEPQRKALEAFNKEYAVISSDALAIKQLIEQRVSWARILNKLSLDLPSGIWFNEISASEKDFILQGAAVSLEKDELGLIKKLLDNLKNDPGFFDDFKAVELSSVQKKAIGTYDVVDFVLTGTVKSK